MDYACLGFDTAGFITHVDRGTKEFCKSCARQIRGHYKTVKVVDDYVADILINADLHKWIREIKENGDM